MAVCLCFIGKASAQWVVSDPGNLAQGIINTTKQIVQTSTTAKNTLDGFMEAQKIFQFIILPFNVLLILIRYRALRI